MSKTEAAVSGMFIVKVPFVFKSLCAFFDFGATHSYLSIYSCCIELSLEKERREKKKRIQNKAGKNMSGGNYGAGLSNRQVTEYLVPCKRVSMEVAKHEFLGNLNQFDISESNIVLGMS